MILADVDRAARILSRGGIVAIPTETVYGLAALVHDHSAVARVFAVKGRPTSHPLIVHLSPADDPARWGSLTDAARRLAMACWPGPLTILVPRTSRVPDWVTGGRDTVALRVPNHPLTMSLLDRLDDALVAPSANRFGRVSPTNPKHVADDLGDEVDMILDGGPCRIGVESTIVECMEDEVRILRHGAVTADIIATVIGEQPLAPAGESRAPGMLASHYAPRATVVVCDSIDEARAILGDATARGANAMLVWEPHVETYAATLYEHLRRADHASADVIVAVLPPDVGLGSAIRERLIKASAPR